MSPEELNILQHSLGFDQYGRVTFYRNHFCTGESSKDHAICMSLTDKGFMRRRANIEMYGGDDLFIVTESGKAACLKASPKRVRQSPILPALKKQGEGV